jgi:hypothetical protein
MTVEISRGPNKYDYDPIELSFRSVCDLQVRTSLLLTVSFVRNCARAEFHKEMRTFHVSMNRYVAGTQNETSN